MASPSNLQSFMLSAVLFSSLFGLTESDPNLKGCPFDSIYSLGVRDSSHRCSTMIDELASAFHLPSPKVWPDDGPLPYGVSFATENAITLTKFFIKEKGIQVPSDYSTDSITAQLSSFGNYLDPMCSSRLTCRQKFQRALFMVDFGSNDYKYSFLNGKSIQEVEEYTPHITKNIEDLLKEIRKVGMAKIVVPGILPLGCLPGSVSLLHNVNPAEFDADNCHIGLNNLAKNHNDQLKHVISEARSLRSSTHSETVDELPEIPSYAEILYADYYNSFITLLRENSNTNHRALLFQEDGFHLSEKANKYIVEKLLSGKNFIQPEIHLQLPFVNHCVM